MNSFKRQSTFTARLLRRRAPRASAGALITATMALSGLTGCIEDPDCGICDPENLILQSLTGRNYALKNVNNISPECEGEACPTPFTTAEYFVEDVGKCVETEEAQNSDRGAEEYCRISPLVTWQGVEMIFNNLLNPSSIELVRKKPDNPNLFEAYEWRTRVAEIRGPITRFNGDFVDNPGDNPDLIKRSVNLSCVENVSAQLGGTKFHEAQDADPFLCDNAQMVSGQWWPLRTQVDGVTKAYRGETDWRRNSCTSPQSGPDTCCNSCDFELSVNVAKYGVNAEGQRVGPGTGAIPCDAANADVLSECANFIPFVNRANETRTWAYDWPGTDEKLHQLPFSDRLRETHPGDREDGLEKADRFCQINADCEDLHGLEGAMCVGTNDQGQACTSADDTCAEMRCVAEWFVECKADNNTTGSDQAFCVDSRYQNAGAGGCYVAESAFQVCDPDTGECSGIGAGEKLIKCDANENKFMSAEECCQASLGASADGAACDPLFQPNVRPVERFERDPALPEETRDCYCGSPDGQDEQCREQIEQFCTAPHGSLVRHDGRSNEGAYITRFVTKTGGVIYDPAIKGLDYRPGDLGWEPRAYTESCAEGQNLIPNRNINDGWRAHDSTGWETYENFDRGMCSASEYRVVFATDGEHIEDKVGNDLSGKEVYRFRTPEFRVQPNSGFPTDNLRIGACDDFSLRFSNKFDLDPGNLAKIEIVELEPSGMAGCQSNSLDPACWVEGTAVAGGQGCTNDTSIVEAGDGIPCLTIDVSDQWNGEVRVNIDSVRFGRKLFEAGSVGDNSGRYRFRVPGLELDGVDSFHDLDFDNPDHVAAYQAAFYDVCGMPLMTAGGSDHFYDFSIDQPKCREDKDGDGVQLSCDNAQDHFNPDQADTDADQYGDIEDLCATVASAINTSDSDSDGVGNDCDNCRQLASKYNLEGGPPPEQSKMWVRNIPFQSDFDEDGIGDPCDNCPSVPNCMDFGPGNPHQVGQFIDDENTAVCQADGNSDMIGDACLDDMGQPIQGAEAAGPVGFGDTDDFDQDGLSNLTDACPRQPLVPIACTSDADCPEAASCSVDEGVCNHKDSDGDGLGNNCDTCPFAPNPMQDTDVGAQEDDDDGDFVGAACETSTTCAGRKDPRPYGFFDVAVDDLCCVTQFPGEGDYVRDDMGQVIIDPSTGLADCEGLCDPDGLPIQLNCENEPVDSAERIPDGVNCRRLPDAVAELPGVLSLPPGCEDALSAAGKCDPNSDPDCDIESPEANRRLLLSDGLNEQQLWDKMCFLPQWDQDFDGLGDSCDLCPFAFDPFNEPFVDADTGKLWDDRGRYCFGDYDPEVICAAEEDEGGTGTTTGG